MEIGRDQSETKETVSQVVGVEHSVIWIWKLGGEEVRRKTDYGVWIVVLETCAAYQLDWIQDQCLGAAEDWRAGAEWATWTAEKTEVGQIWALEEKKWGAGYGCDRGRNWGKVFTR